MAIVYADSPGAAFSQAANLDQQRVQNYLNSIAANRNAQLQGWQAAERQAAVAQELQQREQQQMMQLAQQAAQAQERQRQFAENMGLSRANLAEITRHNIASEGKPNASEEALQFKKQKDEQAQNEQADYAANVADLLNRHAGLQKLLAQVPTTPEARGAAVGGATGEGFMPKTENNLLRAAAYVVPFLPTFNRAQDTKASKEAEVKQNIAATVAGLPADFSGADSIEDYAKIAAAAINARIAQLPEKPKGDLAGLIGVNDQGVHVPLIQRPTPAPLELTPAERPANESVSAPAAIPAPPPPIAQPSLPYFRNDTEIKAARIPSGTSIMLWDQSQKRYRRAVWE